MNHIKQIQEIRDRARKQISEGAVTDDYKLDRKQVVSTGNTLVNLNIDNYSNAESNAVVEVLASNTRATTSVKQTLPVVEASFVTQLVQFELRQSELRDMDLKRV